MHREEFCTSFSLQITTVLAFLSFLIFGVQVSQNKIQNITDQKWQQPTEFFLQLNETHVVENLINENLARKL